MFKITYDLLEDIVAALKSNRDDLQLDMANYLEAEYTDPHENTDGMYPRPNLKTYNLKK